MLKGLYIRYTVLTILAIYWPYIFISFQVAYVVLNLFILLPHLICQGYFTPILLNFCYNSSVDPNTGSLHVRLPYDPARDPDNNPGGGNTGGDNNPGGEITLVGIITLEVVTLMVITLGVVTLVVITLSLCLIQILLN